MDARPGLVVVGAVAAIAGGVLWVVKSAAILTLGDQPPLVFELAGPLFAVALLGLHRRIEGRGGAPARAGIRLAVLAIVAMVTVGAYALAAADPSDVVTSIGTAVAALSTFVGLLLLGLAARRTGALPPPWTNLPFFMGVGAIPAMTVVGGLLAAIHERLLELPILAYGVAWIILGVALRSSRNPIPGQAPIEPAPRLAG